MARYHGACLFADDVGSVGWRESGVGEVYRLKECREALEIKELKISRSKNVKIEFNFRLGERVQRVDQNISM